ncbi:MAG TPA: response regulator, partial [Stellaceae bacterium]|nr:response regulator [Stellaceae bacterium]
GEYISIAEEDTGHGMDETTLKRAAEPFYTTKGVGRGTGLGLSMVDGLVAQSGGAMRISSRPGLGTTVELWLPVSQTPAERPPAADPGRIKETRSCRILVVDDDPDVAASTAAMLEDLGHTAIESGSAEGALQLLRSEADVELVITDHAMPGMTGTELAARIRQIWPQLPVAIATGYAELPADGGLDLPRLTKPYHQQELAVLLTSLIGDDAARPPQVRAAE